MQWFIENWQNLLVGGIVAIVLTLVIVFMIRAKKKGKNVFSCADCDGNCPSCKSCDKK